MDRRQCHGTPLTYTKISSKCVACYEDHQDNKPGYKCQSCEFYLHEECTNTNIPSRHNHPMKLNTFYNSRSCHLCHTYRNIHYECPQCGFNICIPCARKPLIFNHTKAHEHELHQLLIQVSFTCYACGLRSTEYPCFCLQCCFIIHRECIFLPRVIYINRHDHRISHVSSLGPGKWTCGVCFEHIDGEYGAYSCLACSYVVHSKCATDMDNWDEKDLEGVPDEKEVSKPFEVIDQNLIKHFSHEHNLKASSSSSSSSGPILRKQYSLDRASSSFRLEEPREHCNGCTLPLYSERYYKCTQCDFVLHNACANLPLNKRHEIGSQILTLCAKHYTNFFLCNACGRYCNGFSYISKDMHLRIDVRCVLVSGAIKHESHPHHWLFVVLAMGKDGKCKGCDLFASCVLFLRCKDRDICGGYNLCFKCATLPTLVRHKYDDHPLSLCYGEKNVNETYFCGICEEEVYSKTWFYKCDECGSTLHTLCVFGNLLHSRPPGFRLLMGNKGSFDLLPNNRLSRPVCYSCKTRCTGDLVLNYKADTNIFICCSCGFTSTFIKGKRRLE